MKRAEEIIIGLVLGLCGATAAVLLIAAAGR